VIGIKRRTETFDDSIVALRKEIVTIGNTLDADREIPRMHFARSDIEQLTIINFFPPFNKIKFPMNAGQVLLLDDINDMLANDLPVRDLLLKDRKFGGSTLLCALAWLMMRDYHLKGVIMGQNLKAANHLFRTVKLMCMTDPKRRSKPQTHNKRELIFPEGGEVWVGSADSPDATRSDTNQFVIGTEYAFWPRPETQMRDLYNTVLEEAGTFFVLESTANGMNDFQNRWVEAKTPPIDEDYGMVRWKNTFVGWPQVPELYSKQFKNLAKREKFLKKLSPAEQRLLGEGYSAEQLLWRRGRIKTAPGWTVKAKLESFYQEYPENDTEAFRHSGRPFFETRILNEMFDEAKADFTPIFTGEVDYDAEIEWGEIAADPKLLEKAVSEVSDGRLSVWAWPEPYVDYEIGADVSEGLEEESGKTDDSAFCVMRRDTGEYVATWRGKIHPEDLAYLMTAVGLMYNEAYNCTEENQHGFATLSVLEKDYPAHRIYRSKRGENINDQQQTERLGFKSNRLTKMPMLDRFARAIRERAVKLYDLQLLSELLGAVADKNGRVETGGKDLLIAAALTWEAHNQADDYQKAPRAKTINDEYREWRRDNALKSARTRSMYETKPVNHTWAIPRVTYG